MTFQETPEVVLGSWLFHAVGKLEYQACDGQHDIHQPCVFVALEVDATASYFVGG